MQCPLLCPSQNQAEAHYKGHKHARRLKAIEAMKSKQKAVGAMGRDSTADFTPGLEGDEDPSSAGTGRAAAQPGAVR